MNLKRQTKQLVCERARFACEYCGISEQDAGGELTIDHFRPLLGRCAEGNCIVESAS